MRKTFVSPAHFFMAAAVLLVLALPVAALAAVAGDTCTSKGSWLQLDAPAGETQLYCDGSYWTSFRTMGSDAKAIYSMRLGSDKGVQVGTETACNSASDAGTLRYDSNTNCFELCDGSAWSEVGGSCGGTGTGTGDANLLAWWKFDESSGTSAQDSSVNGNTGTLVNGPAWQSGSGQIGGALSFDGSDDYVSFTTTNMDFSNGTGSFSIAMWLKPQSFVDSGNAGFGSRPIEIAYCTANPSYLYVSFGNDLDTTSELSLQVFDSAGTFKQAATANEAISTNEWVHFVGVFDRANASGYAYLNGKLSGSVSSLAGQNGTIDCNPATISATLGGFGTGFSYNGLMDDVRMYNRALSALEVAQLYQSGAATKTPVGWWKMDETSGATAADSSGNGHNGTLNNNAAWVTGKSGNASSFDGTDDYITAGDPADDSLDFGSGSFSYGLWVYPTANVGTLDMPLYKGGNAAGTTGYDIELGTGAWNANISDGTTLKTAQIASSGTLNAWTHIMVVVDRSRNTIDAYRNGTLAASTSISGLGSVSNSKSLTMGTDNTQTNDFQGYIDDARIYRYALSANDVQAIYEEGSIQLSTGLVSHWTLDETTGTTAADTVTGNNGTLTNMTPASDWVSGKIGNALNFDGTDDYITAGDPADGSLDFGSAQDFSVSFWARSSTDGKVVVSKKTDDTTPNPGYIIKWGTAANANKVNLIVSDGTNQVTSTSSSTVTTGTWVYVTATVDRDGLQRLYVNGILEDADSVATVGNISNAVSFQIGRNGAGSAYFNGDIDDVRVYNKVLSGDEIKDLYRLGLQGVTSGLIAYWKLDEDSGTTAYDNVGGYDATLTNGPVFTPGAGQVNGSLYMDGTNDYLAGPAINLGNTFTIIAWVLIDSTKTGSNVVAANTTTGTTSNGFHFFINSSGTADGTLRIETGTGAAGNSAQTNSGAVTLDRWQQVAVLVDRTNGTASFYVNGAAVTASDSTIRNDFGNTAAVYIGAETGPGNYLKGSISEMRIYNRLLTADEVNNLYLLGFRE